VATARQLLRKSRKRRTSDISVARNELITKGLTYAPERGDLACHTSTRSLNRRAVVTARMRAPPLPAPHSRATVCRSATASWAGRAV